MKKLSENQRHSAYELLYRRLVAYRSGGPQGCRATVGSRTKADVQYEVEIGVDSKGLWWRCGCPYNMHQPSQMCSHIGAAWLVWQAILRGTEATDETQAIQA